MQKTAAWIVVRKSKCERAIAIFKEVYWLPLKEGIWLKIAKPFHISNVQMHGQLTNAQNSKNLLEYT